MKTTYVTLIMLLSGCGGGAEQQASPDRRADVEPVTASEPIDLQIAQCTYAENASIHGRPAAQWRAEHYGSEDPQSLNLTVWSMKAGGADQFSYRVRQNGQTYHINTVEGSPLIGSGSVSFEPLEEGGRFQLNGKDQSGNDLHAVIFCNDFITPAAEGG